MPLARFATDKATIWTPTKPASTFEDGGWERDFVDVAISAGGKIQRDQDGAEFTPMTTYFSTGEIARGQRIKPGEHLDAEPPADAETLRKVDSWTPLAGQPRDWVGYTG